MVPTWRDPWAWIACLAVGPLVARMWGAPRGVPVADDFDYLHHLMLSGHASLLDGCGALFYWRPLSRQVYFGALGPLLLSAPGWVATFHLIVLVAATVILYRTFRLFFSGPVACVVASFPLLNESTRLLLTWPSNFQDLSAILFTAIALHEAARDRLGRTMAALGAALLCKEVAVTAALLVPWLPRRPAGGAPPSPRRRWLLSAAVLVAGFAIVYIAVLRQAGLTLPDRLEGPGHATRATVRMGWALWNSLRSVMSLPSVPVAGEATAIWWPLAALGLCAGVMIAMRRDARARFVQGGGWIAWGLAWFVLSCATLIVVYPAWSGYRAVLATWGLGLALTVGLTAAHPALMLALSAVRLVALLLNPPAPATISAAAFPTGAWVDYPNMVRSQRLMEGTEEQLRSHYPTLPRGARVVQHNLPRGTEWAFAGSKALQVWYRDSTLRWLRFEEFQRDPSRPVAAIVEFQPEGARQVALVEPGAMRELLAAQEPITKLEWKTALEHLDAAERAQRDSGAAVFLGTVAAKRSLAFWSLGDPAGAEREATRALRVWRSNADSRFVLALVREREQRYPEAIAQIDTLLLTYPDDRGAREVRARIAAMHP